MDVDDERRVLALRHVEVELHRSLGTLRVGDALVDGDVVHVCHE
ncbi:hypothetical protein [Haloferax sulfurifontis]|nr:hypothetical protein [Haloferax sulfurifontis]